MATTKSLMVIVEKNADGKVSNVGRKFMLEQITTLSPEAMAAGFSATIRELDAQIDAFVPAQPPEESKGEITSAKLPDAVKVKKMA